MMNNDNYKLPVLNVVAEAFIRPWSLRYQLIRKLFIPVAALIALNYIGWYISEDSNVLLTILLWVINAFIYVYLAVACHRIILLGSDSVPPYGIRKWSMRETRFLAWFFGVYFLVAITAIFFSTIVGIFYTTSTNETGTSFFQLIFMAAMIPGIYILSRLSLIFPATAVDQRPNMSWAWDISERNGWRLFIIVGVLPTLAGSAQGFLLREDRYLIEDLILSFISYIILIIEITAISISYRELASGKSNKSFQPTS